MSAPGRDVERPRDDGPGVWSPDRVIAAASTVDKVTGAGGTVDRAAVAGDTAARPLVDRLVAAALLLAIRASGRPGASAARLVCLADGHGKALDRARALILLREDGRPTRVTADATASLLLARTLSCRVNGAAE